MNTPKALRWRTYPMGGAASERMERRGLKAFLDHAVNLDTGKTLCGVNVNSLCADDSLATDIPPDCPKCAARIEAARKRLTH